MKKISPNSIKKAVYILPILIVMLAIILNPSRYIKSAMAGLFIFGNNVFPALFPFFFFSKLLTALGLATSIGSLLKTPMRRLYHIPSIGGYILFMSILSGYPVGAKLILDAYDNNLITVEEAKKIMAISSVSGPLFIIGTVGTTILKSTILGYILLLSHILAALINGFLYRGKDNVSSDRYLPPNADFVLENIINNAVINILMVGGYIVIFYIIGDIIIDIGIIKLAIILLSPLNIEPCIIEGVLLSLIEMTRGLLSISSSNNLILKVTLMSGLIAFGGLSITIQSITFLSSAKIKVSSYLIRKLTQSIITIIITFLFMLIFYPQ